MYKISCYNFSGEFILKCGGELSQAIDLRHDLHISSYRIILGYLKTGTPIMVTGERGSKINVFNLYWLNNSIDEVYKKGLQDNVFDDDTKISTSVARYFNWRDTIIHPQLAAYYEFDIWTPRDIKEHCSRVMVDYFKTVTGEDITIST